MGIFKDLYATVFRYISRIIVREPDALKRGKQDELRGLKLLDCNELRDVDAPFNLLWSIVHDDDFEEFILFDFSTDGGILLHRELATFEDATRAMELVTLLKTKYGNKLRDICLAPGVSVYIGERPSSGFNRFISHVCALGYELVEPELEFTKRDSATKEILAPEVNFRWSRRIGFLEEHLLIPDDFDTIHGAEIEDQFSGPI